MSHYNYICNFLAKRGIRSRWIRVIDAAGRIRRSSIQFTSSAAIIIQRSVWPDITVAWQTTCQSDHHCCIGGGKWRPQPLRWHTPAVSFPQHARRINAWMLDWFIKNELSTAGATGNVWIWRKRRIREKIWQRNVRSC